MQYLTSILLISQVLLGANAAPAPRRDELQTRDAHLASVRNVLVPVAFPEEAHLGARSLEARTKPKHKAPATTHHEPEQHHHQPTDKKGKKKDPRPKAKKIHDPHHSANPADEPVPSWSQIRAHCHVPRNKALFWSGTGPQVRKYREERGVTTDSTAYPKGYTKIFRNGKTPEVRKKDEIFAARFSHVFAENAEGEVRVMVDWNKGPGADRYFHKYEWPVIKKAVASGRITKVIQVNPHNFDEERPYNPAKWGLSKREAEITDLDNIPWDADPEAVYAAWKKAGINL